MSILGNPAKMGKKKGGKNERKVVSERAYMQNLKFERELLSCRD